jgi:hypothetical protein
MCQFTNLPMFNIGMVGAKNLSPHVLDDINAFDEMNATIYMANSPEGPNKP